jgi:hypothetical protein
MESVQGIVEGLKYATYEITALLLPGVVLIAIGHEVASTPAPGSLATWLVASYTLGLVLQGVSSWASRRCCVRWLVGGVKPVTTSAQTRAKEIVTKELGAQLADEHLLDVVLTRVQPYRAVYDKFLALADTVKALALVAVLSFALVVSQSYDEMEYSKPWLMLLGLALAWLALCERHRRFAPLAQKALYGKFVALFAATPSAGSTPPKATLFNVLTVTGYANEVAKPTAEAISTQAGQQP